MLEIIKTRYNKGYIRIDQLKKYVELGVITAEQFKDICEMEYNEVEQPTETAEDVNDVIDSMETEGQAVEVGDTE